MISKIIIKYFSSLFVILIILKLIDIIKSLLIASKLGVSASADIFMGVVSIPDSLIVLVGIDSIKGVVNSEFSSYYAKNENIKLWDTFNKLANLIFFSSIIFTFIFIIFRTNVIDILLPGFSSLKKSLAYKISLIIFPLFFIKSITGIYHASMNALKHFYFPVIINVLPTLVIIASLFLPYINDEVIYNLSYATLLGNILIFVFSYLRIKHLGGDFKLSFSFFNDETKRIVKGCGSIIVLLVFEQIFILSKNIIASYYGEGAISSLNYARAIPFTFMGLIFGAVFSVLLTNLSNLIAIDIKKKSKSLFINTIFSLFYFIIPVTIILLISCKEILSLLYLRGNFTIEGIEITLLPFRWEIFSILTFILYIIPTALFLAKKEYSKLNKIGSSIYIIGVPTNLILCNFMGFYGISVSNLIITGLYGLILLIYSRKFFGKYKVEIKIFIRLIISGLFTLIFSFIIKRLFFYVAYYDLFINIKDLFIMSIIIILIYYLSTYILKVDYFKKLILQKLKNY
ncbi:MAG: hypothetical protein FJ216_04175 [Ignavibacteria bacterium]|nr:hypothetical protein [Ignavibacteria bacterium]